MVRIIHHTAHFCQAWLQQAVWFVFLAAGLYFIKVVSETEAYAVFAGLNLVYFFYSLFWLLDDIAGIVIEENKKRQELKSYTKED